MNEEARICSVEDVPSESTLLITVRDGFDEREAVLSRLDDGSVVGFENYCKHWTDVRLDKGSGALVRSGELVCQRHGATFQRESGYCDFGPCEGASLASVDVSVVDGDVYLTDDDYEFVRLGAADPGDLSSGSRIGFDGT